MLLVGSVQPLRRGILNGLRKLKFNCKGQIEAARAAFSASKSGGAKRNPCNSRWPELLGNALASQGSTPVKPEWAAGSAGPRWITKVELLGFLEHPLTGWTPPFGTLGLVISSNVDSRMRNPWNWMLGNEVMHKPLLPSSATICSTKQPIAFNSHT